jgi:membrane protein DedA with SNARE-associated domain
MAEWIIGFIEQYGYVAIVALMALENIFPPLPSELIMPFAGFSAAQGSVSFTGVVIAGTCGSLLGTLPWYAAGRWLKPERLDRFIERHGRWLTITHDELEHARGWFERHGTPAVLFGRMVPAVRTVISVPAGITHMPIWRFLLWSAIGSALWSGLLAAFGRLLGARYDQIVEWMNPVTNVIIAGVLVLYVWRVVTYRKRTSPAA